MRSVEKLWFGAIRIIKIWVAVTKENGFGERRRTSFRNRFFQRLFSYVFTDCGQTCGQKYSKVFCVLLYNRKSTRLLFAIHKNKIKIPQKTVHFLRNFWSEWHDLNVRPLPPQGSALPTAPHPDKLTLSREQYWRQEYLKKHINIQ